MLSRHALLTLLPATLLLGCPSADPEPPGPDPVAYTMALHAEGTNDWHPMLPWPSDAWLVEDASRVTGRRLEYDAAAIPRNRNGAFLEVEPYRRLDGFPPSAQPMTTMGAEVDTANLAIEGEYDESLLPASPTLLVNLDTGALVAHFVQNDLRVDELDPGAPTMIHLHPAARLDEDTTYGVAFRDTLRSLAGDAFEAHPAFAHLRDGTVTTSATLEARRPAHERMFEALEALGVPRASLVTGWTFHTASGDSILRDVLAMRDDAMERVPIGGGECTVNNVDVYEEVCAPEATDCEQNDQIRYRIFGTFRAPLYMERQYSPTVANRDPITDLPTFNDWHDVSFTVMVPHVAYASDATRFVTYGHGLMGSQGEVRGGFVRQMAANHDMVFAAADMHGMSEWDIVTVGSALADMSVFPSVTERLMQGVVNWLVMTRSLRGGCSTLPELADYGAPTQLPFDTSSDAYYLGISQGSIMGMVYSALSLDITKAAVLVGGQNYSVMIPRSSDFPDYEQIFLPWYRARLDQQIMLSLIMGVWDKSEPNSFVPHIVHDPLPGTPGKQILKQIAVNDSQVPNISSEAAARTMGIPLLTPTSKPVWGLETVTDADEAASAMVYFNFDRPLNSAGNVPPQSDNGVHGDQRFLLAAQLQIDAFLRPDGVVRDFCAQDDGAGCTPE